MKYYAHWQPLSDEDAHTALVFGFLRHAPVAAALAPWLSVTLGSDVRPVPLTPHSFWPRTESIVEGSEWTEPELAFDADDGDPLVVVIEAKPEFGQQRLEQVWREAVDVANDRGCLRIAVIMIGADLGAPMPLDEWRSELSAMMAAHGLDHVEGRLEYASWASLGRAIEQAGSSKPQFLGYAEDVVAQLRRKELLGYLGAPVLDDLDKVNIVNVVEGFNRAVAAIRQFFLQLHTQQAFLATGLEPYGSKAHRIQRDGTSTVLTQRIEWHQTHVIVSAYRRHSWEAGRHAFAAFNLVGDYGEPEILAGAGIAESGVLPLGLYEAGDVVHPDDPALRAADWFPVHLASDYGEWVCDTRPWRSDQPDDDMTWTVDCLKDACHVWDK